jgi:putative SOS response-associated peptidase YedK
MWSSKKEDAAITLSCTILTQAADGPIAELHHRQPVRLPEAAWARWLNAEMGVEEMAEVASPGAALAFYEVDRAVNSGRASGARLVQRLGED